MRVVLDTNILLSACLKPDGLEARMVSLVWHGWLEACTTEAVRSEYRDVLLRDKFLAVRERATAVLTGLEPHWVPVIAASTAHAASDEDDNRFLECASAAQAEYLVTGNLRHYPAQFESTRIVNARGFLGPA
jgi:putative PIN family toxin of toxin-antitoxin system